MAPYQHHVNTHHKAKKARRIKKISKFALVLLILISGGIGVDWLMSRLNLRKNEATFETQSSVRASKINIFRTPYFQFQADDSWAEVPEKNTENKFFYKRFNKQLVEHQLVVFVNQEPDDNYAATRVMAVELNNGLFTKISEPDRHCNNALAEGGGDGIKIVTFEQVTFKCNLDSETYRVFVGVIGGTNQIEAIRPNGEKATYTIIYDDVTFMPSAGQIDSIIDTFQIR
jgi:hypothetical protein